MVVKRFDICIVDLNPVRGSEIYKVRPCVVISPDEMNDHLGTVIIAPITSTHKNYPSRIDIKLKGKNGQIIIDQLRTIDKVRIQKKAGVLELDLQHKVCDLLKDTFEF